MRVLLLNYEYPPLGGGAGNATKHILDEFAGIDDIHCDVVTSSTDTFRVEQHSERIRLHFLDIQKNGNIHVQSMKDLLIYAWKSFWYARTLVRTHEYDVVHVIQGIPAGFVAWGLRLPFLVSLRGSDVPFYNTRWKWLDRCFFQFASVAMWKRARAVIANSDQLAALANTSAPSQAVSVIPNGIDIERFTPAPEPTTPVILTVARLIERKGVQFLIRALAALSTDHPTAELHIVGEGNMRTELEELARTLGVHDRVQFLGVHDHTTLPAVYHRATLFALASQNEGMSNAALEAIASGLPVVLTDTGGAHMLADGNGIVVPVDDQTALESALHTVLSDNAQRAQDAAASRIKAETLSWNAVATAYHSVYRDIIAA